MGTKACSTSNKAKGRCCPKPWTCSSQVPTSEAMTLGRGRWAVKSEFWSFLLLYPPMALLFGTEPLCSLPHIQGTAARQTQPLCGCSVCSRCGIQQA